MPNIVYVLTNPAMPGIVKIGMTNRADVQQRMNELYTTGVPLPFECVIALQIEDRVAVEVEKALHTAFRPYKINPSREFFDIEPEQVEALLRVIHGKDVTTQVKKDANKSFSTTDLDAATRYIRKRRPPLNFQQMGIPYGSTLVSVANGERVTVSGPKTVNLRDRDLSLSAATNILLNKSQHNSIRGTAYWAFEGRILTEIYDETYVNRIDESPVLTEVEQDRELTVDSESSSKGGTRTRKPPINLHKLDIRDDSILVSKETGVEATVSGPKKVLLNGVEMSLSAATNRVTGSDTAVRGPAHWTYKGRLLTDIREEMEEASG